MKTRNWLILLGILVAIPVGWYLISPLFINETVNEDFPIVQLDNAMADMSEEEKNTFMAEATQAMETAMTEPDSMLEDPMPEEDMSTMEILFQGSFYDIAHHGMGTATVYELADGSRILRFEGFEVLNGPDLHVYLAPQDPVLDTVGVTLEGSLDLGKLKGNIGDQNYEIPAGLDLSQFGDQLFYVPIFHSP
ncbi:MAG: DM13 domain-containing protein [Anaerolineae bacterium]|nr:DM13 domain-containing protein [Anaerolineae bacterium]